MVKHFIGNEEVVGPIPTSGSLNSFAKQNNPNVHKIAPRPVELFYTRINELRDSRRSKSAESRSYQANTIIVFKVYI